MTSHARNFRAALLVRCHKRFVYPKVVLGGLFLMRETATLSRIIAVFQIGGWFVRQIVRQLRQDILYTLQNFFWD